MLRALKLVPEKTSFDFIGKRYIAAALSGALVVASLVLLMVQGLNFGIDFRGGILIEVRTAGPADIPAMRRTLDGMNLGDISLQEFGSPDEVLIRIQRQEGDENAQTEAIEAVRQALGDEVEYRRTEFVGPQVSDELRQAGTLAVVLAMGAILLYIWFRFEWQYGLAAVIALIHDVVATIGLFAFLQIDFSLATVAAILTIAGYSINDTVVIFDRVRENLRRYKSTSLPEILNRSANETLSRTLVTSVTTLLAVVSLYLFGGEIIRGFTLALIWGVVIGTYSSLFVAIPLLLITNVRRSSPGTQGEASAEAAG